VDEARFDDLFLFEYPRLVGALVLVTGARDIARDAVDEACARAWERLQRGKAIDSLAAWVRVASLNVARGSFRRRAVERRARAQVAQLVSPATAHDHAAAIDVRAALARLPRRQREVVALHYFLDCSVDDIAAQLDINAGTVKTSLHRARSALASVLGDPNDEVFDGIS
jgi:RNA polymerase sigma-70 factor (ECF subfamily)